MPHQHASEYAKDVGQDRGKKDVLEVYDAYYGTYKCDRDKLPEPSKAGREDHSSPFKLGQKP